MLKWGEVSAREEMEGGCRDLGRTTINSYLKRLRPCLGVAYVAFAALDQWMKVMGTQ